MLRRLVVALLEGALPGLAVALSLARFGISWEGPAVVYASAALTGVLTGLVAGKPIWANGAKLEALLKAPAGAFLAVASLYGIRKWVPGAAVDLGPSFGVGSLGAVPFASLPLIGVAIAVVLEVDDAFGADAMTGAPHRVEGGAPRVDPREAPATTKDEDGSESDEGRGSGSHRAD